jgi:hypothetical protein
MPTEAVWSWKLFIQHAESSAELRAAILEMSDDGNQPAIEHSKSICAAIAARIVCEESLREIQR